VLWSPLRSSCASGAGLDPGILAVADSTLTWVPIIVSRQACSGTRDTIQSRSHLAQQMQYRSATALNTSPTLLRALWKPLTRQLHIHTITIQTLRRVARRSPALLPKQHGLARATSETSHGGMSCTPMLLTPSRKRKLSSFLPSTVKIDVQYQPLLKVRVYPACITVGRSNCLCSLALVYLL